MKTKQQKRAEAEIRQAEWNNYTPLEKLGIIRLRRGRNLKEVRKLNKQLESQQ